MELLNAHIAAEYIFDLGANKITGCSNASECDVAIIPAEVEDSTYGGTMIEITWIAEGALSNLNASYIELSNNIIRIDNSAFSNAKNLHSIVIPRSVQEIGARIFEGCDNLQTILCEAEEQPIGWDQYWDAYTPDSVQIVWGYKNQSTEGLQYQLTEDCRAVSIIGYEGDSTEVQIADLYQGLPIICIDKEAFLNKRKLQIVQMTDSITKLEEGAFSYCTGLKQIRLSNNIISIPAHTFSQCVNLQNINLPEICEEVGIMAFHGCSQLVDIQCGANLKYIRQGAFEYCENLQYIVLPTTVIEIDRAAFTNCPTLSTIVMLSSSVPQLTSGDFPFSSNTIIYSTSILATHFAQADVWKEHLSQVIANDLKLSFVLNAQASKKYFTPKQEFNMFREEFNVFKEELFNSIYPVGSVYLSMSPTNPTQLFGGEWVSLSSNRTLWLTSPISENAKAGDLIKAGLPNITGKETKGAVSQSALVNDGNIPEVMIDKNAMDTQWEGSAVGLDTWGSSYIPRLEGLQVLFTNFDASRSNSIYGNSDTVQPPAIRVYGWRRIS